MKGYWEFRAITYSPADHNTGRKYRKYLGMPENVHIREWFTNAEPEQRDRAVERAKQLIGPHGYTVYKVWRAQCQR